MESVINCAMYIKLQAAIGSCCSGRMRQEAEPGRKETQGKSTPKAMAGRRGHPKEAHRS